MLLRKGFKFRLEPTNGQRQLFAQFAGASRFLYNRGLEQRKTAYEKLGKSIAYFEQNNELVSLKKQETTLWLKDIHSQVLQQALKNLDTAFQNFFENIKLGRKPGFPRFKCKGIRDSFRYPQGVKVESSNVYLPKIGWVRFRKSREIEGEIKQTTILREGEHWYVSFSTEKEVADPALAALEEERAVGIDMGIKTFATMATGTTNKPIYVSNPRFLKQHLPRLRVLARRLSKKVKFSRNWLKAKKQLVKLHARIKHCREDFAHKLSTTVVKSHDIICVEGLNIANLLAKGTKSLSSTQLTKFLWFRLRQSLGVKRS
jgi:putative transposase